MQNFVAKGNPMCKEEFDGYVVVTRREAFAFCPNCGYRLWLYEDRENYYTCHNCSSEFDLDGFKR